MELCVQLSFTYDVFFADRFDEFFAGTDQASPFLTARGETPVNFAKVVEKVDADLNPHAVKL